MSIEMPTTMDCDSDTHVDLDVYRESMMVKHGLLPSDRPIREFDSKATTDPDEAVRFAQSIIASHRVEKVRR